MPPSPKLYDKRNKYDGSCELFIGDPLSCLIMYVWAASRTFQDTDIARLMQRSYSRRNEVANIELFN